jgi:hypothetical protein
MPAIQSSSQQYNPPSFGTILGVAETPSGICRTVVYKGYVYFIYWFHFLSYLSKTELMQDICFTILFYNNRVKSVSLRIKNVLVALQFI